MKYILTILISICSLQAIAQKTLEALLQTYNSHNVPYMSVQELAMPKTKAIILDAREPEEFSVSHLKDAVLVGYSKFDIDTLESQFPDKNRKIVVYCSLGIRSETIAIKLQSAGYTNVYNLYGGIFEWKNNDFPLIDMSEHATDDVHAFSKGWSKWLTKGNKVYGNEH